MLMVHNNESLDLLNTGATDEEEPDEMLLTRTEPLALCAAESTARSTNNIPGEFEKRISDIKAKLNQIKNSINSEMDNKPQMSA